MDRVGKCHAFYIHEGYSGMEGKLKKPSSDACQNRKVILRLFLVAISNGLFPEVYHV
jgi:hypothetical protein